MAGGAFLFAHKAFDVMAHKFGVGFFPAALEVGDNAFVFGVVCIAVAELNAVFLATSAVEDLVFDLFG